jgi:acetoin utilization deacetylase AcuC-like enzyme
LKHRLLDQLPTKTRARVSCRAHLAAGAAKDLLPRLASDIGVDLTVVGVRQHSMLGKLVLGSSTEALLRKAPCHILTVPVAPSHSRDTRPEQVPTSRTALVRDARFLGHRCAGDHHESHERLVQVYAHLEREASFLPLVDIAPRPASREELSLVHAPDHIRQIEATAGGGDTLLTADTYTSSDSYETARLAAGGVLAAIDAVLEGQARNAFVLARPPGHHAERSRAMGFCLFNNTAIGARYACLQPDVEKVLIVDWDVHHGNGIQHIFEQDPRVLYFSTHQYPHFPGTGYYLEVGRGGGEGYTFNVPVGRGWGDGDLVLLYQRLLVPVAQAFVPDLILVAAGFDPHRKDPMGKMKVTETGFAALARLVMQLAGWCCRDRLVLVLEGGYHPKALSASVYAVLTELADETHTDVEAVAARGRVRWVDPVVKKCTSVMGRFWPCLLEPSKIDRHLQGDGRLSDRSATRAGL